jgi:hypothetical protein
VTPLPPFEAFLDKKRKIRRATEEAGIPYTFVSANCFGAYFVNVLLRPHEQPQDISVYGSGEAKGTKASIPFIHYRYCVNQNPNSLYTYTTSINIYILCLTAVMNYEEDIAMYTIKMADDPETCNRVVIYRPQKNIVSQLELISLWEKKTGKTFNRIYVPEDEIVKLSESKKFLLTRYFLIFDVLWLLSLFI